MKVLALSTSTPRGSAALVRDGDGNAAIAEATYVDLQGHAERLFEAIDSALVRAGETRASIDAVACDVGPGSFTGARVGVASGKGIALALGVPLVGVVSLQAMAVAAFAEGAANHGDLVMAAIDAKKGEVFLAAYDSSGEAQLEPCTRALEAAAFTLDALPEGARLVVAGEVAAPLALPEGVRLARAPALDLPDAAWIGRIALRLLAAGVPSDPELCEPLYVRAPDATPMMVV